MTILVEYTNGERERFEAEEIILADPAEDMKTLALQNPDKYIINRRAVRILTALRLMMYLSGFCRASVFMSSAGSARMISSASKRSRSPLVYSTRIVMPSLLAFGVVSCYNAPMEVIPVLTVLALAAILAAAIFCWLRLGPDAYRDAYRQAQQDDIDYVRQHPGCTLEEAHQHRDRVRRRFWWR